MECPLVLKRALLLKCFTHLLYRVNVQPGMLCNLLNCERDRNQRGVSFDVLYLFADLANPDQKADFGN